MRHHLISRVLLFACIVICAGASACKPDTAKVETKAEPSKEVAASVEDAGAAEADVPERFSLEEINHVLLTLKACVDENSELSHMAECGCLSDLGLSREPQPEDVDAYCRDFAAKTVASSKLSEAEQMKEEFLLAAKDIPAPGSAGLFSFAAPCMVNAYKKRSKEHHKLCLCAAHVLANKMATRDVTTTVDVVQAMEEVGKEMQASKVCQ